MFGLIGPVFKSSQTVCPDSGSCLAMRHDASHDSNSRIVDQPGPHSQAGGEEPVDEAKS